jgi:cytokinin dehydrogenase
MAATATRAADALTYDATTCTRDSPPPALDGEIRFDELARAAAADDFGHIVHKMPQGILRPRSANDVAATIRWVAERGLHFAPQRQKHSVFGRGMTGDGLVGDMSHLRTIHNVQGGQTVVDAGATWRQVLAATLPQGLAPPVPTEYLGLSVGGTLVVGGVGPVRTGAGISGRPLTA